MPDIMGAMDIAFPNLNIYLENVPKSFTVFGFTIALYGVIIGCGFLLGLLLISKIAEKTGQKNPSTSDPVVGWLICVRGVHFGEAFNIYMGRNSLGRSHSNRICLSKDNTISREKHAWITYEPRRRTFLIQPGESAGLVYVNGESVLTATEISGNEYIEIGNTRLQLIPLCGENFSWEMFSNDDE